MGILFAFGGYPMTDNQLTVGHEPVSTPHSEVRRAGRPPRVLRWGWWGLILVILVIGGVGGFWLTAVGQAAQESIRARDPETV